MQINYGKDLPVSWAEQMKNKDSEESSKGSVLQNNFILKDNFSNEYQTCMCS